MTAPSEAPSALPTAPPARHRVIAGAFTDRVLGTTNWEVPTPVPEWTARDVVRHLVTWFPGFLSAGAGTQLPGGTEVGSDPVGAWRTQVEAIQELLDNPATRARVLANPHIGEVPLDVAIDRFYTTDVFMHTWDLARATGQDDRLDPGMCAQVLAGMEAMEGAVRSSGQFGTRVTVPANADAQTPLLGFIGRDPQWRPAP